MMITNSAMTTLVTQSPRMSRPPKQEKLGSNHRKLPLRGLWMLCLAMTGMWCLCSTPLSAEMSTVPVNEAEEIWETFETWGEEAFIDLTLPDPWDPWGSGGPPPVDPQDNSYPPEGIGTNWDGVQFTPGATVADDRVVIPQPDLFSAMITDFYAPTTPEIEDFIAYCNNKGFNLNIYNYDLDQVVTDGSNVGVQMVCNHVPEYSFDDPPNETPGHGCFTIVFPQNFDIETPLPYPILFQANGWGASNNVAFDDFPYYQVVVNNSYHINGQGLVYVQWNCGGCESLGLTEIMQQDVDAVFDMLAANFNCNKNQVVAVGTSRGGGVAIQTAKNPYGYDFNVIGLFITNPPIRLGTLSQTALATHPALCSVYTSMLGPGAQRYDFDPPPLSNPAPVIHPVLETDDPVEGDLLSPDGNQLLNLAGKYILYAVGTHDVYFRFDAVLGFDRKLSALGIPHTAIYCLASGHSLGKEDEHQQAFEDFVIEMLMAGPFYNPTTFVPANLNHGVNNQARNYYLRTNLEDPTDRTKIRVYPASLPFVATMPWRLGRDVRNPGMMHEPGLIVVSGAQGRSWRVVLKDDTGTELQEWSGVFTRTSTFDFYFESDTISWSYEGLPDMDTVPYYTWEFYYQGTNVSSFTDYTINNERVPTETEIVPDQPWNGQYTVLPGAPLGFGIDYFNATHMEALALSWP